MKHFYEKDNDNKVATLELDEDTLTLKTWYGEFRAWLYQWADTGRKSEKTFPDIEKAKKAFEKKDKDIQKKYILSDTTYPLSVKKKIERVKNASRTSLRLDVYHPRCFEEALQLTHLEELEINYCPDSWDIPESLGQFVNLKKLKIVRSNFRNLPINMGDLKSLEELIIYASHDKFKGFPESLCNCSNLKKLSLHGYKAKNLPLNIGKLTNLIELDCGGLPIKEFPESIGECQNLQKIHAENCNKLQEIPPEFAQLHNLEMLYLGRTGFRAFPKAITQLPNLRLLDYSDNHHTHKIPDLQLPNLETLEMEYCDIKELPEVLDMPKLQKFNLQNNELKSLPDAFFKLTSLEDLVLQTNKISIIQEGFKNLNNLTEFNIFDNPIKNVPTNIAYQSLDAIADHLGWSASTPTSVNSELKQLSEEEQSKLVKKYDERFDKFLELTPNWKMAPKIVDYLSFKTDNIPLLKTWVEKASIHLYTLFAPLAKWTEIENRLMLMLASSSWGNATRLKKHPWENESYALCFFRWYNEQIEIGKEPKYEDILAVLEKYGLNDDVFEQALSRVGLHRDGKVGKFGKVVQKHFKEHGRALLERIQPYWRLSSKIISFLIEHSLKDFEKHADFWFSLANGSERYDIDDLRNFVFTNPQKHAQHLVNATEHPFAPTDIIQVTVDLHLLYGEQYKEAILKTFTKNIFVVSNSWSGLSRVALPKKGKVSSKNLADHFEVSSEDDREKALDFLRWMLNNYGEEMRMPIIKEIQKSNLDNYGIALPIILNHYQEGALPLVATYLDEEEEFQTIFQFLPTVDYSEYHSYVWNILEGERADNNHKKLAAQELLRLYNAKEIHEKASILLAASKAQIRDGGIRLLSELNDKKAIELLKAQFEKETDAGLRNLLLTHLKTQGEEKFLQKTILAVFEKVKKANKLKSSKKWLDESKLPVLHWKNGKKATPFLTRYLFHLQKAKADNSYQATPEIAMLLDEVDHSKDADFAKKLLDLCLKNGGLKSPNKALLPFTTLLGDEQVIEPIQQYCTSKNNVVAATLLGNMDSLKAAQALDSILLHFKTKYPNIREAANDSFERIAAKHNLSRMELMDKMIPDFGFTNLFKHFEVNGAKWRAYLAPTLKMVYLNEKDEAKKSIPTKTDKAIKDEFKALNKDIRSIARRQKQTLEYYLVTQRRWTPENWQAHFMKKPITFAFAQSLIWGIYKKDKLSDTFAVNQDQALENIDLDEITLPKNTSIGLVHPLELSEAQIKQWTQNLRDSQLEQAFPQLERKVFKPNRKDLNLKVLDIYKGTMVSDYYFRKIMREQGWSRGSVIDSGMVFNFSKTFENLGIEVFVEVDEMYIHAGEYSEEITLEKIYFAKANTINKGSYVYDTCRGKEDERVFQIKELPAIVYSEILYDFDQLLEKGKIEEED